MKRFLVAILSFLLLSSSADAAHIIGGEMRYTFLNSNGSTNTYRITLILFRGDDPNGAPLASNYVVGIYNNDNNQKIVGGAVNSNHLISKDGGDQSVPIIFPGCIQNAPTLNYTYAVYTMTVDLPVNQNGYTVAYQTCCRINGMINVANSTGSTYACIIPGLVDRPTGTDSSPMFSAPVNVICKNSPFTLNFSAVDPDSEDVLVYSLCDAWNGGASTNAGFADPAGPPYGIVNYNSPYSGGNPFGTAISIDPNTGIISGTAPDFGKYVVSVCIDVYRNGIRFASHRKDLIVQVSDCNLTAANPMPNFVQCEGDGTVQFSHTSNGANTVFWDFGVASLTNDTANTGSPQWTYTDTGVYNVKFVINRGTSCADSVVRKIGVFPGFVPGFIATGGCFTNPFLFRDTTNPRYGSVNGWRWNFGDGTTLADTARIRNPQWTYPTAGTKDVTMIVTSTKGCIDTIQVPVVVFDKPPITLAFKDTLICIPDALQLNASGNGTFSWTPLTNIVNPNTGTPTVNPSVTTKYYVELNDNGCINRDSVQVRVVAFVTLNAMPDTTICATDSVQLGAVTDGLRFIWTPGATISNPNILNPFATPVATVTPYQIEARIGSCRAIDNVTITTVPYPIANAGPPQIICYNTSAQLNGSHDGSSFFWTPTSYLNNPNILNPVSSPPRTTQYILSSLDTKGCPKPGRDTIIVTVLPRVRAFAGRDTSVVVGQPLQFNGTGGVSYVWSPSTGLNNTTIFNPIGVYNSSIDSVRYKLVVRDIAGCADSAFVKVTVFKTKPSVFIPSAFTPNNDGRNDVIRPIAVGIAQIKYFSIYNRWGQLVFTTTINGKGWDGRINGVLQSSNVYVWMVNAIDYTGQKYFQKGTVTLIR